MSNSTSTYDNTAIAPAQTAALSVSILAILIFISMSIYLCGRHRGWQDAMRMRILRIAHLHRLQSVCIRIPDDEEAQQKSEKEKKDKTKKDGRLTKLKKVLGFTNLETRPADAVAAGVNETRTRATSPLQIQFHSGSNAISSSADEFQAAVHNLLGYAPREIDDCSANSNADGEQTEHQNGEQEARREGHEEDQRRQENFEEQQLDHTQERAEDRVADPVDNRELEAQPGHSAELFFAGRNCGSPLPPYEEVEPWRFSWQGDDEASYRPEKREPSPAVT